jgi:hypothetical protein
MTPPGTWLNAIAHRDDPSPGRRDHRRRLCLREERRRAAIVRLRQRQRGPLVHRPDAPGARAAGRLADHRRERERRDHHGVRSILDHIGELARVLRSDAHRAGQRQRLVPRHEPQHRGGDPARERAYFS